MNKFIIAGRVSKTPELLKGENYEKVHINIGSYKRVKKDDKWENGTAWNSVTVFGKMAEQCAKYLEKGQWVTCEGVIENIKKGDVFTTYLTANSVEFGPKANVKNTLKIEPTETTEPEDLDDIPF